MAMSQKICSTINIYFCQAYLAWSKDYSYEDSWNSIQPLLFYCICILTFDCLPWQLWTFWQFNDQWARTSWHLRVPSYKSGKSLWPQISKLYTAKTKVPLHKSATLGGPPFKLSYCYFYMYRTKTKSLPSWLWPCLYRYWYIYQIQF